VRKNNVNPFRPGSIEEREWQQGYNDGEDLRRVAAYQDEARRMATNFAKLRTIGTFTPL
jgi:hypothetical protein